MTQARTVGQIITNLITIIGTAIGEKATDEQDLKEGLRRIVDLLIHTAETEFLAKEAKSNASPHSQ